MMRRNWRSASHPGSGPAQRHVARLPVLDVARAAPDAFDHRLARVGARERLVEVAADREAGQGERLLQAFAQGGGGAGMAAVELGSEDAQLLERPAVIGLSPRPAQP